MFINFSKYGRMARSARNLLAYMMAGAASSAACFFVKKPKVEVRTAAGKGGGYPSVALAGRLIESENLSAEDILRSIGKKTETECSLIDVPGFETEENRKKMREWGALNLHWYDDVILDLGRLKIGVSVFTADAKNSPSLYRILKRRKSVKKGGAQVTLAYVKRGDCTYGQFKKQVKRIARSGYTCAVGQGTSVNIRRNMRTMNFSETSVFYSLGELSENFGKDRGIHPSAVVKLAFDGERKRIAQQGYFPAYVRREETGKTVFGLCAPDESSLPPEEKAELYRFLQQKMKGLRRWGELLCLRDIFNELQMEMPEKYAFMADYTVNYICSRTLELAPGNVFFFRQQFRDKNDSKAMNETIRLKLALRAVMRRSLFIFSYRPLWPWAPHVVVEDGMEAHIAAMAGYRRRLNATFIGITGSVGKTSTKDMLYCALSRSFKTEKSSKNSNVQIRIGANLQKIGDDTEIFIQEIGGGRPGGASRHSRMIAPDAAVITNIGTAHLGNFGSQTELMENKLRITEGMGRDGMLFLNGDDPLLVQAKTDCKTCYFAVYNKNADYYAENIRESGNRTSFDVVWKDGRFPVTLQVLGIYNVLNAVCCFAVGRHFGMSSEDIAAGIGSFKTSGTRQNLVNVGGYRLFVDCFNASLSSVESSLSVLTRLKCASGKRRNAVIGDITGMGEMAGEINRGVAAVLDIYADRLDQLILYGSNGDEIASAMENRPAGIRLIRDPEELNRWMKREIDRGDVTLFKGGSKSKLDERIDDVFGTNFADGKYVEESRFTSLFLRRVKYRLFAGYATAVGGEGEAASVRVKNRAAGRKVKKIAIDSFRGSSMKKLFIGRNVKHIGSRSFLDCRSLTDIRHRDSVLFIGRSAFENCHGLVNLQIPNRLRFMGARAFKNCSGLETVRIPSECAEIPTEAFAGCTGLRSAVIEEGVLCLSDRSFAGCTNLEEIRIPHSAVRVGRQAFRNCVNLKRVYVASETAVDPSAFAGCGNVEIIRAFSEGPLSDRGRLLIRSEQKKLEA